MLLMQGTNIRNWLLFDPPFDLILEYSTFEDETSYSVGGERWIRTSDSICFQGLEISFAMIPILILAKPFPMGFLPI